MYSSVLIPSVRRRGAQSINRNGAREDSVNCPRFISVILVQVALAPCRTISAVNSAISFTGSKLLGRMAEHIPTTPTKFCGDSAAYPSATNGKLRKQLIVTAPESVANSPGRLNMVENVTVVTHNLDLEKDLSFGDVGRSSISRSGKRNLKPPH
jgi:hypothetical protein